MTATSAQRDILVTGLHRSGTTFVGHVLSSSGLFQVVEPCNKQYGSVLVDRWKPYPDTLTRDGIPYREVVDRIFSERIRHKPALQSRHPLVRRVGGALGLHRQALGYNLAYLRNRLWPRRRLFKDPDLIFFADELQRSGRCEAVILVRHPCAFHASVKRLGWRFPLADLLGQEALVEAHLGAYPEHRSLRDRSFAEESALVWLFTYSVVRDFLDANADLILVRHEDLAARPLSTFRCLFERLGLKFGARVKRMIEASTGGTRIRAGANRPHDLVRDSRGLAWDWTRQLSPDEVKVTRDIVAPVFGTYYESWLPDAEA